MPAPAAVLFDLDGTLIDTTELILASCAHTFERHLAGGCPPRDVIVATFGRSLPEALREMAAREGTGDPEALAELMLETYRAHNDRHHDTLIRPFEGVEEMLAALAASGIRLGVVTSKREGAARRGLQRYGLERFFEAAVFHDDTERHKPHPEPLLLAATRLAVPRELVVYVGDSVHDIAAGAAAGMQTIAVLWGPFPVADLEAARPDRLVASPGELAALLRVMR